MFELKARLRHIFGRHTPVQDIRSWNRWCYVCGKRLPADTDL